MRRTAGPSRALGALAGLLALALVAPTAATATSATGEGTSASVVARAATPVRHVVAISLDGLKPEAIRVLGRDGTPALHRMMRNGASTLNARTEVEMSVTLPNHTGMLTGRRVLTTTGHHVDFNLDLGTTVHEEAGAYRASLFDVVHNRGGSTGLFVSKDKFAMFDRTWSEHGAPDRVGEDDGTDKIDAYSFGTPAQVTRQVARRVRNAPLSAAFLHISLPDVAGHAHGWMSEEYLDAVRRSDELVRKVVRAVRSTRYLRRHAAVVVAADHGGQGTGHSDATDPDNYVVPLLALGAGVARGADLYDLNADRVDPGTGRPGYADGTPPIRNTDVASLVTALLGFRAVPGGLLPDTRPLRVS